MHKCSLFRSAANVKSNECETSSDQRGNGSGNEKPEGTGEAGGSGTLPQLQTITTRWSDNDVYGHVNNVVYFSYFDTVVNQCLIEQGVLDIHQGELIGLVVENTCRYFQSLQFPDRVSAGLHVQRLGTSSVIYRISLFRNEESAPAAEGRFVHVYVDRRTRRPVPLPQTLRAALVPLLRQE